MVAARSLVANNDLILVVYLAYKKLWSRKTLIPFWGKFISCKTVKKLSSRLYDISIIKLNKHKIEEALL